MAVEAVGELFCGVAVTGGYGVGVHVERGRGAGVRQPGGDNWDSVAGREHLGGHEVAQIAETMPAEPDLASQVDEPLVTQCGFHGSSPGASQANT